MSGQERRKQILQLLSEGQKALSGSSLAKQFAVSRQVIVQDIALLRANGSEITSTNRGYVLQKPQECSRVFKMHHTNEEAEEELFLIVDYGGTVRDVFVYHKVYGTVKAEMNIRSRQDARDFMADIKAGKSSLLMNVTSGYHYHTVLAKSEKVLDLIQERLQERGFLARLQDYEPVDFWSRAQ